MSADAWPRLKTSERDDLRAKLAVIGSNADRYRVEIDADYGFVLSVHAFSAEVAYQTIDVVDMQIDGRVADELFELDLPAST